MTADAVKLVERRRAFASAIRYARPHAAPGNVFVPDVLDFFRRQIESMAREAGAERWAALLEAQFQEQAVNADASLAVNGDVPWGGGPYICAFVLWRLPALPPELEYRFIGADLALIDVRAGLVVDVLEEALPLPYRPDERRRVTPCDVHPDLPACWS